MPGRIALVFMAFFTIAFEGACSQSTDAYIDGIQASRDGRVVVFSTHSDESAYVVTKGDFVRLGRAPFAVSETGRSVAAIDAGNDGTHRAVIVRRDMQNHRDDRFELREQSPGSRVIELRCDDDSIYCQILNGESTGEDASTSWLQLATMPNQPRSLRNVSSTEIPSDSELECTSQEELPGRMTTVYASSGGVRIVQTTPQRGRSTISREVDNQSQILLTESPSRFWTRQAASQGFQYP